jgi:pimeloyl-ACP methyl ester carboxylesterase
MTIVYIHGATATSESFGRIRDHITEPSVVIDYLSAQGFRRNLRRMAEQLEQSTDLFFVAHSLGGIYSLYLASEYFPDRTLGAVTLSTPYGGSHHADYARFFLPWSQLMQDINTASPTMRGVRDLAVPCPWLNVVTTAGASPWIAEPNDGVVTVASQRARTDIELIELAVNHYEVVISDRTIAIIRERLQLGR